MKATNCWRLAMLLFCGISAAAQTATPTLPTTGFPGLDQYRASRIAIYMDDYGQLARYRDANHALKPLGPGEDRVIFFGDSITDD